MIEENLFFHLWIDIADIDLVLILLGQLLWLLLNILGVH